MSHAPVRAVGVKYLLHGASAGPEVECFAHLLLDFIPCLVSVHRVYYTPVCVHVRVCGH